MLSKNKNPPEYKPYDYAILMPEIFSADSDQGSQIPKTPIK